jgi:hypothetical protein
MENRPSDAKVAPSATSGPTRITCGPPPARYIASSFRTATRNIFLAALLCHGATAAHAGNPPPLAWACWISEQEPISIKCIRDRSHLSQTAPDNQEAALLNLRPDTADAPPDTPGQPPQAELGGQSQLGQTATDEPDDELEAEVLDQIYSRILVGDTARLDDLVEKHNGDLRKDSVWAIKIHTLPIDSSWLENRPARIVKSALCRGYSSCSVILREPGH